MTKTHSMSPAPSHSLHSKSKRPQKPSSDRACLQALTGAGYALWGAGHKPCQHLLTVLQLPCWTTWVSGLAFPLSIKHARHLHFFYSFFLPRRAPWPSRCEIFRGNFSCSLLCLFLSPSLSFERLWFVYNEEQGNFNLKQREMLGEKNYFLSRAIATVATKLWSSLE